MHAAEVKPKAVLDFLLLHADDCCREGSADLCVQLFCFQRLRGLQGEQRAHANALDALAIFRDLIGLAAPPASAAHIISTGLHLKVGTPEPGRYKAIVSSDDKQYGGQGRINNTTEHFTHPEGTPGRHNVF